MRTIFFNLVLVVSLLLLFAIAQSRFLGIGTEEGAPECESVYGVSSGDTCVAVQQAFNLTTAFFDSVNPNLDCNKLFVGQWLCVDGTLN